MKNKKSKNQQFAVIGLGRFGSTVAKTLFEKGEEVLAVDIKEEVITEAHEYTTHAVVADVTDDRKRPGSKRFVRAHLQGNRRQKSHRKGRKP